VYKCLVSWLILPPGGPPWRRCAHLQLPTLGVWIGEQSAVGRNFVCHVDLAVLVACDTSGLSCLVCLCGVVLWSV
jgi:hypothetical protein